jgi:RNA polymerase II subunit A small phosphatase-like protein
MCSAILSFADTIEPVQQKGGELKAGARIFAPAQVPPQQNGDHGKLTVVLDIDETLVHTSRRQQSQVSQDAFQIKVFGETLTVFKRPNLDRFLKMASERFELISYTAGREEYSQIVLKHIDPDGTIFKHRLFRQHCARVNKDTFVKDLSIVNRCPSRLVLVDNTLNNFLLQPENGIPVTTFVGGEDNALNVLWDFLRCLESVKDVRIPLRATFKLPELFGNQKVNLSVQTIAEETPGNTSS